MVKEYILEGLDCASCASKIEDGLNKSEYVEEAFVNFVSKTARVTFNNKIDSNEQLELIKNIVKKHEPLTKISEKSDISIENSENFLKEHILFIIGVILYISAFFLESFELPIRVIAYILIGHEILYSAILNTFKGKLFDEQFLMSIATFAAFYIGESEEAVGVFIFYKIGEILEEIALKKSRKNLLDAHESKELIVMVKDVFMGSKYVNPNNVKIGSTIILKPGEKLLIDSIANEGALFNQASITGESLPVFINKGEIVLAGSVILNKSIELKSFNSYEDSSIMQIQKLIDEASLKKGKTEKYITRFSRVYTPIVVSLAIAISIIPPLFGLGSFDDWVYVGAIFLVVSCPCALVISVPLVYFMALGAAASRGIIIKGTEYIEKISKVNNFIFDKTGTLTKGLLKVNEFTNDKTILLAASGERFSSHPIAMAIVNAYSDDNYLDISNFEENEGMGVTYNCEFGKVRIGKLEYIGLDNLTKEDFTSVHVSLNDEYVGSIYLEDEIKEHAKFALDSISQKSHIVSGDNRTSVIKVAKELGIVKYKYGALPKDKLSYVEALMNHNAFTCFIGDGINDAPVLSRADIGISIGSKGNDLASISSDIVILDDDIKKVSDLINLSKKANLLVTGNIVMALVVKVGVMILGIIGVTSLWLAVVADVGVALLAILNSYRINSVFSTHS
jgi:Cd2+/Zn2+-exporting ATPase